MLRTFRSGWARAAAALVPVVLTALLLWLPERLRTPDAVQTQLPAALDTKLWVVLVDSLAARDVTAHGMPRLFARLNREGLHGPVRACADAVTVPCLLAMVRGSDHFSLFALERNFGGGERALEHSILGELARRGARLGYFGEPQLARPLRGFDLLDTGARPASAQLARAQERAGQLDLLIVHLLELDDTSHLHGADSARYRAALRAADRSIDALLATRPDDVHVAILGDHGHTRDGRHAAGLDVTTYAAYFGSRFPAPRATSFAITDHAAIWARIYGGRRGDEAAHVRALFESPASPSRAEGLPPNRADPPPPDWYALLVIGCAPLIAFGLADLLALRKLPVRALLAGAVVLALGCAFVAAWPVLRTYELPLLAPLFALCLGLGLLLRHYPIEQPDRRLMALSGALVFAPPVLALAGGPRLLFAAAIALLLFYALRVGARAALVPSVAAALIAGLFPGALAPDVPTRFAVHAWLAEVLGALWPALLLLAGIALAARPEQRRRALGAGLLGLAAAAALPSLPGRWPLLPCALALPAILLALRGRAPFSALSLLAPPALWIFFERDPERLSPLLALLPLAGLGARSLPALPRTARPLALLGLLWASYWTTLGGRIGGVDFDFYFGFLPPGASATSEWPATAALTAAKYLFASALPLLFASQRAVLPRFEFELAAAFARLRLAYVLVLSAIASALRMVPSSWLLGELQQEAALFVLLLLTLGLLGTCLPGSEEAARA